MNWLLIVAIIMASGTSGWITYMILTKDTKHLKLALATLAGAGLLIVLSLLQGVGKIQIKVSQDSGKAGADVDNSKKEDKTRQDIVSKADVQIKANQEMINLIKKALSGGTI